VACEKASSRTLRKAVVATSVRPSRALAVDNGGAFVSVIHQLKMGEDTPKGFVKRPITETENAVASAI